MDTDDAPDQHASEHEHAHRHPVWAGNDGAAVSHPHIHPHHAGYEHGDTDGHQFAVGDVPANRDVPAPGHADPASGYGDHDVLKLYPRPGLERDRGEFVFSDPSGAVLARGTFRATYPAPGLVDIRLVKSGAEGGASDRLRERAGTPSGGAERSGDRGPPEAGAAAGRRGVPRRNFHRHPITNPGASGRIKAYRDHADGPGNVPGHSHPDEYLGPRSEPDA